MGGQVLEDVLHHHDGTIDHHADRNRQSAERHKISRYPPISHGHQGETDRHRHGDQNQERRPQVHQKQKKNHDDQCKRLDQGACHRFHCFCNQISLVIDGLEQYPFGKGILDDRQS